MKKLITALLACAFLAALTGASASEAGTSGDPLVTQSYADSTYVQSVLTAGLDLITAAVTELTAAVDSLPTDVEVLAYTGGRETFLSAGPGAEVTLGAGGSFILLSGSASLSLDAGEVIDISTGQSVAAGSDLAPLTRYFVTEDTRALFAFSSAGSFVLDGPYAAGSGVSREYALYGDVRGTEWFTGAAVYAYEHRLFHDWDADLFRPLEAASRADMVYALWVSAGRPDTDFVSPFTDLTEDWYVTAVNWAYEHNITNGSNAPDLFNPSGILSRQDMITMIYRWTENRGLDVSPRADLTLFPDYASIGSWAVDSASWSSAVGLILGNQDRNFLPRDNIRRSEASTILQRYESLVQSLLDVPAVG